MNGLGIDRVRRQLRTLGKRSRQANAWLPSSARTLRRLGKRAETRGEK